MWTEGGEFRGEEAEEWQVMRGEGVPCFIAYILWRLIHGRLSGRYRVKGVGRGGLSGAGSLVGHGESERDDDDGDGSAESGRESPQPADRKKREKRPQGGKAGNDQGLHILVI